MALRDTAGSSSCEAFLAEPPVARSLRPLGYMVSEQGQASSLRCSASFQGLRVALALAVMRSRLARELAGFADDVFLLACSPASGVPHVVPSPRNTATCLGKNPLPTRRCAHTRSA